MAAVTLVLTRVPIDEFIFTGGKNVDDVDDLTPDERAKLYRKKGTALTDAPDVKRTSGRWGTMLLVVGPVVSTVRFVGGAAPTTGLASVIDTAATLVQMAPTVLSAAAAGKRVQVVPFANRRLELTTDGAPIAATKEFTTIERYRTNLGELGGGKGYVQMAPRSVPYPLKVEPGNRVVKTLRDGHDGLCIRVLGGERKAEKGILIHEAPNVGWVIGCISPRPKGDRAAYPNREGNPSQKAVQEIVAIMNRTGGGKGSLFVLPN
ncbi:MAG TPA: hypothetical protein VMP03_07930 [Methylomirabilota bacterium]|nr:hypothetical protein [Methylomirabilota bacterium]